MEDRNPVKGLKRTNLLVAIQNRRQRNADLMTLVCSWFGWKEREKLK
jgi:hypothetical protein